MNQTSPEVQLDLARRERCGLDEAIYAEGKSVGQLTTILTQAAAQQVSLLLTRLSQEKKDALAPSLQARLDYCEASRTAFFGFSGAAQQDSRVGIVVAGTSDAGVAREAERTLLFHGVACELFIDVGVAGLWRLTSRLPEIRALPILIAIAGMDAALPTVLAGLVASMVIAVPTSVGYGVAAGGRAALHAILASCASGITTVNIDNGYGAACAALRALRMLQRTDLPAPQRTVRAFSHAPT